MRFAAIDVETANPRMESICQVGVAYFENEKLAGEWQTYVDPEDYFDPINVSVHGIGEEDVLGAPVFSEIAQDLAKVVGDQVLVAHTHFDRVAIAQAHTSNGLSPPDFRWLDSASVARRAWIQFSRKGYGLKNLCSHIGYSFKHHDALEDAKAAGHVLIAAVRDSELTLEEWLERVTQPINPAESASIARDGNPEGSLFGEVLVFTGALEIPRREAADMAAQVGCEVAKGVTKKTTLLVVGDQDISRLAGHSKSSKHRKAEELIAKGALIRILRESDFRKIVEGI